jgi:hypothetical protein
MTAIDAAPTFIPESPGHATTERVTTTTGRSGAHVLLAACVVAETYMPLGVAFIGEGQLRDAVETALATQSADHLLGWQRRVAPGEQSVRWEAARIAVVRLYPACPHAKALPDFYNVNFVIAPAQRT